MYKCKTTIMTITTSIYKHHTLTTPCNYNYYNMTGFWKTTQTITLGKLIIAPVNSYAFNTYVIDLPFKAYFAYYVCKATTETMGSTKGTKWEV